MPEKIKKIYPDDDGRTIAPMDMVNGARRHNFRLPTKRIVLPSKTDPKPGEVKKAAEEAEAEKKAPRYVPYTGDRKTGRGTLGATGAALLAAIAVIIPIGLLILLVTLLSK